MSTSRYSIFNFKNSNYSGSWYANLPTFKSDKHLLPMYAVNNTQLMTYVLIGITTVTLGYITLSENEEDEKEREDRDREKEREQAAQEQQAQEQPSQAETTPTTGGKHKNKKTKYNHPKSKPNKKTQRK